MQSLGYQVLTKKLEVQSQLELCGPGSPDIRSARTALDAIQIMIGEAARAV
jgi:hypothetical protein